MIITGKKFSKPAMSRVINGDTILPDAPEKPTKTRLDHILVEKHPEYNRSTLQKFIKQGYVKVNKKVVQKPNTLLESTDIVKLNVPAQNRTISHPPIIYEDENVLVLNKPAGLLSMTKGEYCPEPTLEDYGLLVHRLDRDTSGVVILAKNPETQKMLRKQFQDRKTHKTYYAIVEGRPKMDEALIDLPINRNYKRPNTFLVEAGGKPSQTHYKVIESNDKFSLLQLKPTTGRTHQLRVHLKYLGTPILGDTVYGTATRPDNAKPGDTTSTAAPRLFLHAANLEITIPKGNRQTFSADIPPEFTNFFKKK